MQISRKGGKEIERGVRAEREAKEGKGEVGRAGGTLRM